MPEGRMRCRFRTAEPFTGGKVTLCSVTRCRATPHHRLRAELSRCGSVRRGSRSPPETDSLPRPCFAALEGKAKSARRSHKISVTKSKSPETPSKKSFPHPANPYSTVLYRSVNKIAPTFPQISPHNRRAVDNFCCVHRFSTSNDSMQIRKYPRKPPFLTVKIPVFQVFHSINTPYCSCYDKYIFYTSLPRPLRGERKDKK